MVRRWLAGVVLALATAGAANAQSGIVRSTVDAARGFAQQAAPPYNPQAHYYGQGQSQAFSSTAGVAYTVPASEPGTVGGVDFTPMMQSAMSNMATLITQVGPFIILIIVALAGVSLVKSFLNRLTG